MRDKMIQMMALCWLLLLGGMAAVGPYGVLSWGEHLAARDQHEERIAGLQEERARLENRVKLLDPNHADPDLVSELMRQNLNVAHPDEYVMELEDQP